MKLTEDIHPLSTFRANVAAFVDQVRQTGRPIVLTQRGRSAVVLLGAAEYEALLDELDVLRDIRTAEAQLAAGEGRDHDDVARALRQRVRRTTTG